MPFSVLEPNLSAELALSILVGEVTVSVVKAWKLPFIASIVLETLSIAIVAITPDLEDRRSSVSSTAGGVDNCGDSGCPEG